MVFKSVYESQFDILDAIQALHCQDGIECDLTYGNGAFYRGRRKPRHMFDIQALHEGVTEACSTSVPLPDCSVGSIVFDPPFLTYVRAGRSGNGNMAMAKRFGGYWRYDELEEHYKGTLAEAKRLLKEKGVLVFKCQDIIHNHKMHCTHANVIQWAECYGLRLMDLFVLPVKHRLPAPNRKGKQKHARIYHSYFLVFEATKKRDNKALNEQIEACNSAEDECC
jgi:hypothetical protein